MQEVSRIYTQKRVYELRPHNELTLELGLKSMFSHFYLSVLPTCQCVSSLSLFFLFFKKIKALASLSIFNSKNASGKKDQKCGFSGSIIFSLPFYFISQTPF